MSKRQEKMERKIEALIDAFKEVQEVYSDLNQFEKSIFAANLTIWSPSTRKTSVAMVGHEILIKGMVKELEDSVGEAKSEAPSMDDMLRDLLKNIE